MSKSVVATKKPLGKLKPSLCVLFFLVCVCAKSLHIGCVLTLWAAAHQAPLSMGFSKQEYWSGLPCPPPSYLPNPGIELVSLKSPALAGRFFTTSTTWEAQDLTKGVNSMVISS